MDDFAGIREFYTGQGVLLTGATGFLGKAIAEKLLRTCQDIKMLYLLIRDKKGQKSQQRLIDLFDDPVFGPMKKVNPDYKKKVTLVSGDVSLPDIGLSESDRNTLLDEVTVVFHGAATVRFDETLTKAINVNIHGTKRLLQLASECKNLKALIHISTAYANCNKKKVEELIYEPPVSAETIIKWSKTIPDETLEGLSQIISYDWPNTYVFTKQIAEDFVKSEALDKNIPAAIFRPAIVIGSWNEPIPGWIDNFYGPTGVVAGIGAGLLRTMCLDIDLKTELVPVDMTVNAAFAIACDVARRNRNDANDSGTLTNTFPVYNYVASKKNPFGWKHVMEYSKKYGYDVPTIHAVWYYSFIIAKHLPVFYFYHFLLHVIPALIIDTVLLLMGRKPQALRIYQKVQKFLLVIFYFSTKEWDFANDNVVELWTKLPEKDKKQFNFNIDTVNWDLFFKNNLSAMRIFLFKDPPETLPAARRRLFIFHILHRLLQITFLSMIVLCLRSLLPALFATIASNVVKGQ